MVPQVSRTPRPTRRAPRAPSARASLAAGSIFSLLPMLLAALVSSIPLFAGRPFLADMVAGAGATAVVAFVVRYLFALARGWGEPMGDRPALEDGCTEPERAEGER